MYLSRFGRHCRSRCLGHLLPDAWDCRRALAMLTEVARWVTLFNRSVGVSYRMSAVGLYHNLHRLVCARRVDVLRLPGLAGYKLLGLFVTKLCTVTLILFDS